MKNNVIILEDSSVRIERFRQAVSELGPGFRLILWNSAHQMIRELPECIDGVVLASLDHDLADLADGTKAGCGLDVAKYLARHKPSFPILVHSSAADCRAAMSQALIGADWDVYNAGANGSDWIDGWLNIARALVQRDGSV